MSVEPRSVTAFIGPSGCGKSTFLRTLNRMHEVIPGARVDGKVALDGEDIYGTGVDPVNVRRTIGMVFQRPNPFPTMSIFDNVVAGIKLQSRRSKARTGHGGRALASVGGTCGTRSRTGWRSRERGCPAASSNACASPGPSPSSRRFC